MTKLEQARKLLAEATPGPWVTKAAPTHNPYLIRSNHVVVAETFGKTNEDCGGNRDLIVAAVNQYAALLDVVEAAKAIIDLDGGDSPDLWHFEKEFAAARVALAKWEEMK